MNFGKQKTMTMAVLLTVSAIMGGFNMVASEASGGLLDPGALEVGGPFTITSDAQFDLAHGVRYGDGTPANPYVISNWTISGGNASACIDISGTTNSFVIRNCKLTNASSGTGGVYVHGNTLSSNYSVENCLFQWNAISFTQWGIQNGYQIPSEVFIKNCTFLDSWQSYVINAQGYHVNVGSMGGNMTFENCDFRNAYASTMAFLYNSGDFYLNGLTVSGNTQYSSIGISNYLGAPPAQFYGRFFADDVEVIGGGGSGTYGSMQIENVKSGGNLTNVRIMNSPGYGIRLAGSKYVNVSDCVINNTVGRGLYVIDGSDFSFSDNTVHHAQFGMTIEFAVSNTEFVGNCIRNCTNGIYSDGSQMNNLFWGNAFYDNTNYNLWANSDTPANNIRWNETYTNGGGNYWGDYAGADAFSGPNQDIAGADGFGDTNYSIRTNVFPWISDKYPLMENPFLVVGIDYIVIMNGSNNSSGPAPSNITEQPWFNITVWAAGFNNTVGYVEDVNVTWSIVNYSGAVASVTNLTGNATTFMAGSNNGVCLLTAEYAPGITDMVNVTIAQTLSLDYIVITDSPNGAPLNNVPLAAGASVNVYASGYNVTGPTYIGLVPVNWLDTPDLGTFNNNTGTNTIFTAGLISGIANITGQNISFNKIDNFTATITGETVPPVTTLHIGTPNYTAGNLYVNSSTQFNLTAYDGAGSGVATTWYRVWNVTWSNWAKYAGNFTLNGPDGTRYIEFNSTDIAGNNEVAKNQTVILDNTRPVSTLSVGTPQYGTSPFYINTSTPLNISAVDTGSGMNKIWYRIGASAANWILYSGNFTLGQAGTHTIYYYSVDNLNQTEAEKQFNVTVDINGPGTNITFSVPNYGSVPTYINSTTLINLTGADAQSGIASIWYRLDNAATWTQYLADFTLATPGAHTIYFYGVNNLGQPGAVMSSDIFVDNTPPVSQITIGEPKVGTGPVNITSQTGINITASDPQPGSGLASIWYRVDGDTWTKYTGNFTLTSEGHHNITYNATDNLGQHETSKTLMVFVDNTPPVVAVSPAPTAGALQVNVSDTVTLTVSDAGVGGAVIEYSLDAGATWQIYTGAITINSNITIMYHAYDALGNEGPDQTLTVTVATETIAPPVTPPADEPGFLENYWWLFLLPLILIALLLLLLGRKKKCAKCSKKSANPEKDGWAFIDEEWYCDTCQDGLVKDEDEQLPASGPEETTPEEIPKE